MADVSESVHDALSTDDKKKKGKPHTHSIHYERADNGGMSAHVEKRHKDGTVHSHEHHVLAGPKDAAEHLMEHMGDQPDIAAGGGAPPPEDPADQAQAAPPDPGAGGAPPGGGAAPPPMS